MKRILRPIFLLLILLMITGLSVAQVGGTLVYGGSASGAISATAPLVIYTFMGNSDDVVTVRAVALNPGTQLAVTLLSPAQQLVASGSHDPFVSGSGSTRVDARLGETGAFSVLIGGVNGATGDFVIFLDGQTSVAAQPLSSDAPTVVEFAGVSDPRYFSVSATDSTQLNVRSSVAGFEFIAQIRNSSGKLVGVIAGLSQASFSLSGGESYEIMVMPANAEMLGSVELSLGASTAQTAPPTAAPQTAVAPADRCTVSSNGGVNIRSGASTDFGIISTLNPGQFLDVTGVTADRTWYAVNVNGTQGWVAASVTVLNGPCGNLSVVQPPTAPSVSPTATITTGGGQTTPTATATTGSEQVAPTMTPTATATTSMMSAPPDSDYNVNLDRNGDAQFSEQISYPEGDRTDRIIARVSNFDSVTTFAQYNVTVVCSGPGAEYVRWGTSANATNRSCNSSVTMTFTTDSNNQNLFVTLPEGSGAAYITYTVLFIKIS